MPTAHLICGRAGSGKTEYSKSLENESGAIRFSKDQWIISLFGSGLDSHSWAQAEPRCCRLILELAQQLLARGVDVILDWGFWYAHERREVDIALGSVGGSSKVHFLDTPDEVRWQRIVHRNQDPGLDSVEISRAQFEKQTSWFEPPEEAEGIEIVSIKCDAA